MKKPRNITFGRRQKQRVARSGILKKLSHQDRLKLLKTVDAKDSMKTVELKDGSTIQLRRLESVEPQSSQNAS